jgi:hypothetical protein
LLTDPSGMSPVYDWEAHDRGEKGVYKDENGNTMSWDDAKKEILPNNLKKAMQDFAPQFKKAYEATNGKDGVKGDGNERGYVIYLGSNKKLYSSKMLEGTNGKIESYADELDNPTAVVPDGVTLSLAGIYHSHPDQGNDGDPISDRDMEQVMSYVRQGYMWHGANKKWTVQSGFFSIVDDKNGTYAAVIENMGVAQRNIVATTSRFENLYDSMIGGGSSQIPGTAGEKSRAFYKAVFTPSSGIGVYHFVNSSLPKQK